MFFFYRKTKRISNRTINMADLKINKDLKANIVLADSYHSLQKSALDYSQFENSVAQIIPAVTRTQVVIDALGPNTISNERIWNPANNRLSLIDADVGDYLVVNVSLTTTIGFLANISTQLDYSPALDGSLVVTGPTSRTILGSATPDTLFFNFKFVVNSLMKTNGIAIMTITNAPATFVGNMVQVEKTSANF